MYKRAYGKINIILKVYKKEGKETKHKVDTAIQICKKIYDKIKIKESDNFEVVYTNKYKQKLSFNDCSVNKVVHWFKKNFPDSNTNFKIKIIKRIPPNSGFGGESTDAAFVLNYLLSKNNVYELNKTQLRDLALNVGSDVPFFLSKYHTAHVSGYGDEVKKIKDIRIFYKIYPIMVKCETQKVYEALDNDKNYESKYSGKSLIVDILTENFSFIDYYNDLQKYVFKVYPEIKKHYDNLNNFKKRKIIVNGSGSYLIIFHLY